MTSWGGKIDRDPASSSPCAGVAQRDLASYAQVGHLIQVMPDGYLVELVGARDQTHRHGPVAPASCLR
jgi:hypothetical protein